MSPLTTVHIPKPAISAIFSHFFPAFFPQFSPKASNINSPPCIQACVQPFYSLGRSGFLWCLKSAFHAAHDFEVGQRAAAPIWLSSTHLVHILMPPFCRCPTNNSQAQFSDRRRSTTDFLTPNPSQTAVDASNGLSIPERVILEPRSLLLRDFPFPFFSPVAFSFA